MRSAKAWSINDTGALERLAPASIDLEQHLENWVDADADIVADDVLIIGRQVPTRYGTVVDLLGIDADGDLVVIELKRDHSLRETVAQALEYAAWASKLLEEQITAIGGKRFGGAEEFAEAFERKFGQPLPSPLDGGVRILLVAPRITDATAAVIDYLSETFSVPIDGVSFDVFGFGGRLVLVRHFVREEPPPPPPPSRSRSPKKRTLEEFAALAHENGVGELVEHLLEMRDAVPGVDRYWLSFALKATAPDGRSLAAFSVYPTAETKPNALRVSVSPSNLVALYGLSVEQCASFVQEIQSLDPVPRNAGACSVRLGVYELHDSGTGAGV